MEHKNEVKRAVFLAAGRGTRLAPVTDNLPKPLVKVQGKRIIETLLEAVIAAGIKEIYIVRGYLAEKFAILQKKYPQICFIDNPDYDRANNISSLIAAADLLGNAYIIESDLWLSNPALITAEQKCSNYLAIPVAKTTDWCFYTNKTGKICHMAVGGENCQQMVGISYWTDEDGRRLAKRARELYVNPANWHLYWDEVALDKFFPEFTISTRLCSPEDVREIDTLAELQALDASYIEYEAKL